jgi:DNA-binding MarR family transcriptional regulator
MLSLEATYAIAETCLCAHVQTARRVVARHADGLFRPLGLTSGQFAMLLTLHRAAPITVGGLAKRLTMSPSTATADLKPLERRGLIASRSHATDGRVRLVALTDIGRTMLADAIELWATADDRATGRPSANERRALCLALRRISTIDHQCRLFRSNKLISTYHRNAASAIEVETSP